MKLSIAALSSVLLFTLTPASTAQDLNVKCGVQPTPSPAYGAASGNAGYWNLFVMPSESVPLLDLAGQPTGVIASMQDTCDMYDCPGGCGGWGACAGLTGSADDLALLGSWINADCSLAFHDIAMNGLEPGRYVAHTYTFGCPMAPAATTIFYVSGAVLAFSTPGVVFQGDWSTFPHGRHVFDVFAGDHVHLRTWGTSETGIAGFQLDKLEPTGQASCLGDGTGAACPCGNPGLPGHGCKNSATVRGALLEGVGAASLSFDTLGLSCEFEPPGVTSIVLQGDQVIAPVFFGDGLRCAGGSLKRLFVKSASASGTLSAPSNGGPSISERSAALGDTLQPGASRVYQVYYRDPDAAFCPEPQGSTFNVSNAVEIVWQS